MTILDDSLLGTAPIRSAKPGSKSAGKHNEADAASQRSAFENAFADAGKKKQPTISIGEKPATQASLTAAQNLKAAIAETDTASDTAAIDKERLLPGSADDRGTKPARGTTSAAFQAAAKQLLGPQTVEVPAEQEADGQKFALTSSKEKGSLLVSIGLANLGADATTEGGPVLDEQAADRIKNLLKVSKAGLSKPSDLTDANTDEALPPDTLQAADAAIADVSHLLALLGAAQKSPDAGTTALADTTQVQSEFQALAESAGKAKIASRDVVAAKAPVQSEADANAIDNATQTGADHVFRFARADGKGQAVSMNVASDGDRAVVKNDAGATAASKTETVTVIEARRYLGLAPASNTSAITSQIASNPEWAQSLQPTTAASAALTEVSTGKVLNTLKIQMHPIDLGTVTATLRLKDDELQVELKVETGDAFRQLSDDQDAMVKALRAQGFAVDQVSIVFNSTDSSGGTDAQQQAQPQTGQQGRDAAGDSPAQGRSQRNNSSSQEQGRGRWTGNEGTSDASSGTEPGRTGDVYM